MPSKWADSAEDIAAEARRKVEKEEKKRLKAQRLAQQEQEAAAAAAAAAQYAVEERPNKRRRVSQDDTDNTTTPLPETEAYPTWQPSRTVSRFEQLNAIEEGSYGYVSRARDRASGAIVALKRLKMDPVRDCGFPVTALREIQCLKTAKHRHVVDLLEVAVGEDEQSHEIFLVMEFLEHDLKSLQEDMIEPFTPSEVKTLLLQLASAVEFIHSNWILHRDLKTSNILMNNRGEIKIADFGMARVCGDPPPRNLTQLVVTLWYRAPELLLGETEYGSGIDMWSVGCVFGELLAGSPILQGKSELDQLSKVADLCGVPDSDQWPGIQRLPNARHLKLNDRNKQQGQLQARFSMLPTAGLALLTQLLSMNPATRLSASDMLKHEYFTEKPRPKPTAMFPTFPSKAGQQKRRKNYSPPAPRGGEVE